MARTRQLAVLASCLVAVGSLAAPARATTALLTSRRVSVTAEQDLAAPTRGWLTLRLRLQNQTQQPQKVFLRFESRPNASVQAEVPLAPGERRNFPLLIPATARYGSLVVSDGYDEGRDSFSWHGSSREAILVEGLTAAAPLLDADRSARSGSSPEGDPAVGLDKAEMPEPLAALVGYAAVGLLESQLEDLSEPQRRALEAYAATGGELHLSRVPAHPETILPMWKGQTGEKAHPYGFGRVHLHRDTRRCVEAMRIVPALRRAAFVPETRPRFGRRASDDLVEPSDPLLDVARVPVGGFLVLVLFFALVIGPGSFLLRARKGPHALVLFIPLTALVTCSGIGTYGVFHEGLFTLHAASRTVTLLDSERHRAITLSVDGYYASLAPSAVRYAALAAPMPPTESAASHLSLDETDGLVFRGGLIPSRDYRELVVLQVAPARARLSLRSGKQGTQVENALGARVQRGAAKQNGVVHTFFDVPDGALRPTTDLARGDGPNELTDQIRRDLAGRFLASELDWSLYAPLEEGDFVVALDRAVFAPDGGLRLKRETDQQIVRGRLAP
jgi:hypothetical protein